MSVDPTRHQSVFDPNVFATRRIDVIGAGATGSRIVLGLAKLGIRNIHVWDFDHVEAHNVANQVYGLSAIGVSKVEALQARVFQDTGTMITAHNARVEGGERLGPVVFLLTDTMASRKAIYERSLRNNADVELLVETRMGADSGRVYALDPGLPEAGKLYEATLYEDAVAETSQCGTAITVGPTAEVISGLAVWQFIRWWKSLRGGEPYEFETIVGLRPFMLMTRGLPAVAPVAAYVGPDADWDDEEHDEDEEDEQEAA